jgi:hypothetical protein
VSGHLSVVEHFDETRTPSSAEAGLLHFSSHNLVFPARLTYGLFQLSNVLDRYLESVSQHGPTQTEGGKDKVWRKGRSERHTSRQSLPLARFVVLALWEALSQQLKTVFHFTTAFSLRQFMSDTQLRCAAIRSRAIGRLRVA